MIRTLACALSVAAWLHAQPSFEVASVKASAPGRRGSRVESPPGSLIMNNVTLRTAIAWSHHIFDYQVSGPGWISEERFDISAKAAEPVDDLELRHMLQSLLAERFHLETHKQTKEMQAYVLTVGKNGHKMQQSTTEGPMQIKPVGLTATVLRADLDELAAMASRPLEAPVVNATGLKGKWDFHVDAAPYLTPEVTGAKNVTDLIGVAITAVQEQLGLKLESKRVPVEIVVVDRADRIPVEN